MARESFLLRTDPKVLAALSRWADDEFRSANAQLDFLLRKALKEAGRSPSKDGQVPEVGCNDQVDSDGSSASGGSE